MPNSPELERNELWRARLKSNAAVFHRAVGKGLHRRRPSWLYLVLVDISTLAMGGGGEKKGYAWAITAGLHAALAAIAAKFFASQVVKYGLVVACNVIMWGCYVNSLKVLSSLQATVTNFATNFLSSGLAGFFLFKETLSAQWLAGALLIVIGVIILSKSGSEQKASID